MIPPPKRLPPNRRPAASLYSGGRGRPLRHHAQRPDSPKPREGERWIALAGAVAVFIALGLTVWVMAEVFMLVFGGILFAVFFRSLAQILSTCTGLEVRTALVIVLATLAALLLAGAWFLGAEMARQLGQLVPRLGEAWQMVADYFKRYEWGQALLGIPTGGALTPGNGDWVERLTGIFSTTFGAIASFFIVVFLGLYLAITPRMYRNGLLRLIPPHGRVRAGEVLSALGVTLQWWLIGTVAKMLVVGVATTIGLVLLDVPLALALGLMAFLLEFIPYLGPIIASVPALLVALSASPVDVIYVALLYMAIQAAEGYVVSPLIDQRSVHLAPALAITAQVLFGVALGVLGAIFATPLTAVGLVLVKMLYIEDRLGESPVDPLYPPQERAPPGGRPGGVG